MRQTKGRVLGVIPARGGSKGIPKKNVVSVAGQPLIQYTIEAAKRSKLLSEFVVSTEDEAIAHLARELGASVPFLRPLELAEDSSLTYPVVRHAVQEMEEIARARYDAVFVLQPTTPFRSEDDIDKSIEMLFASDADSVVSVSDVGAFHPLRMKVIENGYLVNFVDSVEENMQPRQELPPVFIRNGAVYLTRRDSLMTGGSLVGKKCLPYVMPLDRSVNIDSRLDLELAKLMLKSNFT